jgi:hypothetical protein
VDSDLQATGPDVDEAIAHADSMTRDEVEETLQYIVEAVSRRSPPCQYTD